ncbi:hypothetical protein JNW90_00905 [Micromonospora sp. STR1s_5]|nr:hypothetical protein [Micromonospora sp. STR1s_5]
MTAEIGSPLDQIVVDPATITTQPPSGADVLAEMRRFIARHTVRVFCHPDAVDEMRAALDKMAAKLAAEGTPAKQHRVYPSPIVPAGQVHVMDGGALAQLLTAKPTNLT